MGMAWLRLSVLSGFRFRSGVEGRFLIYLGLSWDKRLELE